MHGAWLPLGLAVENPWLALGRLFLSSFVPMGLENGLLAMYNCRASVSGSEAIIPPRRGDHWPRAMTIKSSLESGCGLSHTFAQDGSNGTCVKLQASKPSWSGNLVCLWLKGGLLGGYSGM